MQLPKQIEKAIADRYPGKEKKAGMNGVVVREQRKAATFGYQLAEKEIERLKGLLEKSYLEGFKMSGEGYNGEYPFEGSVDESIKTDLSFAARYIKFKTENNL